MSSLKKIFKIEIKRHVAKTLSLGVHSLKLVKIKTDLETANTASVNDLQSSEALKQEIVTERR